MRALLLATIASVGLVGCVGQLDDGMGGNTVGSGSGTNPNPTPNSLAKKMFEDNVYPIIKNAGTTSDCSGCHSATGPSGNVTGFVGATKEEAYATITSYQTVVGNFTAASAGILNKIAGGHQGRVYSDAQKTSINDWLNQEVTERGGGTGTGTGGTETPSAATARVMNEWSACMNITDFTTATMATSWGQMQTNNGSACKSCHSTGGYGMIVTNVAETNPGGGPPGLFTTISTNQYYMIQYFSVDLTQTGANGKKGMIVINHNSFDGVANGIPPHAEHPRFDSVNNNGMTALKSWYDLTAAKVAAGGCGPTKLDPPAQ